eukprot:scaffold141924_cov23-Tisochrysis_lutea.AAC.8
MAVAEGRTALELAEGGPGRARAASCHLELLRCGRHFARLKGLQRCLLVDERPAILPRGGGIRSSSPPPPPSTPSRSHVFSTWAASLPRALIQRITRCRFPGSSSSSSLGTHWQWMCAIPFHLTSISSLPPSARSEKILSIVGAIPPGSHAPGASGAAPASSAHAHSSPSLTHAPSAS